MSVRQKNGCISKFTIINCKTKCWSYCHNALRKKSPYSELFWSAFFPHFCAFGLNTERSPYSVRMRENAGKMRTRITPNTETFYAGIAFKKMVVSICSFKKQSPKLFYKQSVPKSFTKFTGKCLHLILPNFNDFFLKREVVNAKPDNYCKLRLCTGRSYKYLLINIYISEC